MLGYIAIVHVYFLKILVFSFKARRGLQRQNCSWQNIRNFSKYHHMDPKFPGNGDFRKSKKLFDSAQC